MCSRTSLRQLAVARLQHGGWAMSPLGKPKENMGRCGLAAFSAPASRPEEAEGLFGLLLLAA